MIRSALLLSGIVLAIHSISVRAEGSVSVPGSLVDSVSASPPVAPAANQFDRIEHKLDEVLQRLDEARMQPSSAAPRPPGSFGLPFHSNAISPASAASLTAYKPGALAMVHPGPKDTASTSEVPFDAVGGFVYEGGPLTLSDMRGRGVRYPGPVGVELQGWLRAKDAGRYQLATDLTVRFAHNGVSGPTCFLQAWLEGRALDQRSVLVSNHGKPDTTASLVVGADLEPGLYRLRVWTNCTAPQGVTAISELLIKTPAELNLRPVTGNDLLHREG